MTALFISRLEEYKMAFKDDVITRENYSDFIKVRSKSQVRDGYAEGRHSQYWYEHIDDIPGINNIRMVSLLDALREMVITQQGHALFKEYTGKQFMIGYIDENTGEWVGNKVLGEMEIPSSFPYNVQNKKITLTNGSTVVNSGLLDVPFKTHTVTNGKTATRYLARESLNIKDGSFAHRAMMSSSIMMLPKEAYGNGDTEIKAYFIIDKAYDDGSDAHTKFALIPEHTKVDSNIWMTWGLNISADIYNNPPLFEYPNNSLESSGSLHNIDGINYLLVSSNMSPAATISVSGDMQVARNVSTTKRSDPNWRPRYGKYLQLPVPHTHPKSYEWVKKRLDQVWNHSRFQDAPWKLFSRKIGREKIVLDGIEFDAIAYDIRGENISDILPEYKYTYDFLKTIEEWDAFERKLNEFNVNYNWLQVKYHEIESKYGTSLTMPFFPTTDEVRRQHGIYFLPATPRLFYDSNSPFYEFYERNTPSFNLSSLMDRVDDSRFVNDKKHLLVNVDKFIRKYYRELTKYIKTWVADGCIAITYEEALYDSRHQELHGITSIASNGDITIGDNKFSIYSGEVDAVEASNWLVRVGDLNDDHRHRTEAVNEMITPYEAPDDDHSLGWQPMMVARVYDDTNLFGGFTDIPVVLGTKGLMPRPHYPIFSRDYDWPEYHKFKDQANNATTLLTLEQARYNALVWEQENPDEDLSPLFDYSYVYDLSHPDSTEMFLDIPGITESPGKLYSGFTGLFETWRMWRSDEDKKRYLIPGSPYIKPRAVTDIVVPYSHAKSIDDGFQQPEAIRRMIRLSGLGLISRTSNLKYFIYFTDFSATDANFYTDENQNQVFINSIKFFVKKYDKLFDDSTSDFPINEVVEFPYVFVKNDDIRHNVGLPVLFHPDIRDSIIFEEAEHNDYYHSPYGVALLPNYDSFANANLNTPYGEIASTPRTKSFYRIEKDNKSLYARKALGWLYDLSIASGLIGMEMLYSNDRIGNYLRDPKYERLDDPKPLDARVISGHELLTFEFIVAMNRWSLDELPLLKEAFYNELGKYQTITDDEKARFEYLFTPMDTLFADEEGNDLIEGSLGKVPLMVNLFAVFGHANPPHPLENPGEGYIYYERSHLEEKLTLLPLHGGETKNDVLIANGLPVQFFYDTIMSKRFDLIIREYLKYNHSIYAPIQPPETILPHVFKQDSFTHVEKDSRGYIVENRGGDRNTTVRSGFSRDIDAKILWDANNKDWMKITNKFYINSAGWIAQGEPNGKYPVYDGMSVYTNDEVASGGDALRNWDTVTSIQGGVNFWRAYLEACPVEYRTDQRCSHIAWPLFCNFIDPGMKEEDIITIMTHEDWDVRDRDLWLRKYPPTHNGIYIFINDIRNFMNNHLSRVYPHIKNERRGRLYAYNKDLIIRGIVGSSVAHEIIDILEAIVYKNNESDIVYSGYLKKQRTETTDNVLKGLLGIGNRIESQYNNELVEAYKYPLLLIPDIIRDNFSSLVDKGFNYGLSSNYPAYRVRTWNVNSQRWEDTWKIGGVTDIVNLADMNTGIIKIFGEGVEQGLPANFGVSPLEATIFYMTSRSFFELNPVTEHLYNLQYMRGNELKRALTIIYSCVPLSYIIKLWRNQKYTDISALDEESKGLIPGISIPGQNYKLEDIFSYGGYTANQRPDLGGNQYTHDTNRYTGEGQSGYNRYLAAQLNYGKYNPATGLYEMKKYPVDRLLFTPDIRKQNGMKRVWTDRPELFGDSTIHSVVSAYQVFDSLQYYLNSYTSKDSTVHYGTVYNQSQIGLGSAEKVKDYFRNSKTMRSYDTTRYISALDVFMMNNIGLVGYCKVDGRAPQLQAMVPPWMYTLYHMMSKFGAVARKPLMIMPRDKVYQPVDENQKERNMFAIIRAHRYGISFHTLSSLYYSTVLGDIMNTTSGMTYGGEYDLTLFQYEFERYDNKALSGFMGSDIIDIGLFGLFNDDNTVNMRPDTWINLFPERGYGTILDYYRAIDELLVGKKENHFSDNPYTIRNQFNPIFEGNRPPKRRFQQARYQPDKFVLEGYKTQNQNGFQSFSHGFINALDYPRKLFDKRADRPNATAEQMRLPFSHVGGTTIHFNTIETYPINYSYGNMYSEIDIASSRVHFTYNDSGFANNHRPYQFSLRTQAEYKEIIEEMFNETTVSRITKDEEIEYAAPNVALTFVFNPHGNIDTSKGYPTMTQPSLRPMFNYNKRDENATTTITNGWQQVAENGKVVYRKRTDAPELLEYGDFKNLIYFPRYNHWQTGMHCTSQVVGFGGPSVSWYTAQNNYGRAFGWYGRMRDADGQSDHSSKLGFTDNNSWSITPAIRTNSFRMYGYLEVIPWETLLLNTMAHAHFIGRVNVSESLANSMLYENQFKTNTTVGGVSAIGTSSRMLAGSPYGLYSDFIPSNIDVLKFIHNQATHFKGVAITSELVDGIRQTALGRGTLTNDTVNPDTTTVRLFNNFTKYADYIFAQVPRIYQDTHIGMYDWSELYRVFIVQVMRNEGYLNFVDLSSDDFWVLNYVRIDKLLVDMVYDNLKRRYGDQLPYLLRYSNQMKVNPNDSGSRTGNGIYYSPKVYADTAEILGLLHGAFPVYMQTGAIINDAILNSYVGNNIKAWILKPRQSRFTPGISDGGSLDTGSEYDNTIELKVFNGNTATLTGLNIHGNQEFIKGEFEWLHRNYSGKTRFYQYLHDMTPTLIVNYALVRELIATGKFTVGTIKSRGFTGYTGDNLETCMHPGILNAPRNPSTYGTMIVNTESDYSRDMFSVLKGCRLSICSTVLVEKGNRYQIAFYTDDILHLWMCNDLLLQAMTPELYDSNKLHVESRSRVWQNTIVGP